MIRMMLSLAFLDPKLIRATLHGALPRGISTRKMMDAPCPLGTSNGERWPSAPELISSLATKPVCFDEERCCTASRKRRSSMHSISLGDKSCNSPAASTKSLLKKTETLAPATETDADMVSRDTRDRTISLLNR